MIKVKTKALINLEIRKERLSADWAPVEAAMIYTTISGWHELKAITSGMLGKDRSTLEISLPNPESHYHSLRIKTSILYTAWSLEIDKAESCFIIQTGEEKLREFNHLIESLVSDPGDLYHISSIPYHERSKEWRKNLLVIRTIG